MDDALEAGTVVHEEGCFEADHVELFSKGKDKEGEQRAPAGNPGGRLGSFAMFRAALERLECRIARFWIKQHETTAYLRVWDHPATLPVGNRSRRDSEPGGNLTPFN